MRKEYYKHGGIILDYSTLLLRIERSAYLQAKVCEANDQIKATIRDIAQDENQDHVFQMMEKSVTEAVSRMNAFTKKSVEGIKAEVTEVKPKEEMKIFLDVPPTFPVYALKSVNQQFQDYIVNAVMADWMQLVYPVASETWQTRAEANLAIIADTMLQRVKYPERKPTVF